MIVSRLPPSADRLSDGTLPSSSSGATPFGSPTCPQLTSPAGSSVTVTSLALPNWNTNAQSIVKPGALDAVGMASPVSSVAVA